MSAEDFVRRVLEAEKIQKQKEFHPGPKCKWLKTKCPRCGYKIEYEPKEGFMGDLKCPQCGKTFHVTRLNEY